MTFVALLFVTAPYGRHERPGWGPRIPARLGWVVMESPALVLFVAIYLAGRRRYEPAPLALASLWCSITRTAWDLGEILEWTGWAIAAWSLAGLAFALYTAANLVPRARSNLAFYRRTFPDYPRERRAVLPWLL